MIAVILDMGAVAVLIAGFAIGHRRGLLRALLSVVTLIAAFLGAAWCARHLTEPICQWIQPAIEARVDKVLQSAASSVGGGFIAQIVRDSAMSGKAAVVAEVMACITPIVRAVLWVMAFVLLRLVLWLMKKPLHLAEKLPVVRGINALSGAILGVAEAAFLLLLAVWVLESIHVLPEEIISETYLLAFLADHTPVF